MAVRGAAFDSAVFLSLECFGASLVQVEYLNEPIKVRADFEGGRVRPILFKHGGKVFAVERLAAAWEERDGGGKVFYYSVESQGAVYQLSWHVQDGLWYLDAVMMEG